MANENISRMVSDLFRDFYIDRVKAREMVKGDAPDDQIKTFMRRYSESKKKRLLEYARMYPKRDVAEASRQFKTLSCLYTSGLYSPN